MKINSKGGEMNFNFSRDLMSQKRGVSGVVTAVLLILLTIAAIGILWVVVQNFVQDGSSGVTGQADCLQTRFEAVSADVSDNTITIRKTSGSAALGAIRISDGSLTSTSVTVVNPAVGESTTGTNAAYAFVAGNVDVSVAFDLADGTLCPLQEAGSITAVA